MQIRNKNTKRRKYKTVNKRKKNNKTKANKRKTTSTRKRTILKGGGEKRKERDDECPICLEPYNEQNLPITLACRHTFHKNCMRNACLHAIGECTCSLCRKPLEREELNELEIDIPPYLTTVDQFSEYINNKLTIPTTTEQEALEYLDYLLDSFLGTNHVPSEVLNVIMEFELQHADSSYRYQFLGIVQTIPENHLHKKYFKYVDYDTVLQSFQDQGIIISAEEQEEFDNFEGDDPSSYAYEVYEINEA